jgi:DNA-binding SARP family transcriptional activator
MLVPGTSIETPRQQALLAYLALHYGVPQSRTKLASLFWPDSTEGQAHTNLRNLLHKVRQALPYADRWLDMDRHTLLWRAGGCWALDVLGFERAVVCADQAEQEGDHLALRLALEQAIALYYGELLPGCYDAWALRERERCSQVFLDVLERLLRLSEEEGDVPEAIRLAQRLLLEDPLQEATYRRLMYLYGRSGNRAAMARTYQQCAAVLERELGVRPGPATRMAYERLMQSEQILTVAAMKRARNGLETPYALHSGQA